MDIIHLTSRLIVNKKEDGNHADALLLFRGARPEGRRIDVFEFGAGRIAFAAVRLFIWRCLNGSRRKSRSGDGRVSAVRKGGFEFKRRR